MTDRPIVRIYTDPDGTEAYNIDRVDVWMGGQWQETEYDVIEIQYCWCGHSEGSHIMKWSNGYECLGCIDDGCDETCDHSSSHTFAEAEQYAPWGEQQSHARPSICRHGFTAGDMCFHLEGDTGP